MGHFIGQLGIVLGGAAALAFLAVRCRQPVILAYILCGVLAGPWGLGLVHNVTFIEEISHLGITLLLFLAGLCLHPQKLLRIFRRAAVVTAGNAAVSFALAAGLAVAFRFPLVDSLIMGLAMMFSSTILTVKLLPTTRLHHGKMGMMCIGVLILQDLLAIAVLVFVRCLDSGEGAVTQFLWLTLKMIGFIAALAVLEQFLVRRVMRIVDRLQEVLFVIGLAWCFGSAGISQALGLFPETGAFFAGVIMARHPVALFINERLKPIRDFFLVLFFFTLGANLDWLIMRGALLPAFVIALVFLLVKPPLLRGLFIVSGEDRGLAREAGLRLGQLSEFSLLIALLAAQTGQIGETASQVIQLAVILSFIGSSYFVVLNCPTPIGPTEGMTKD